MRVSINLARFFADHRALAFILINQEMKRIKDVEKHISHIFNIKNFYLLQEDHYLPSTEESSIIQSNCTIRVVPQDQTELNYIHEDEEVTVVKNKKKKKRNQDVAGNSDCIEAEIEVMSKKKNKRGLESGDDKTSCKKKKISKNSYEKRVESDGSDCVTSIKKKKQRPPKEARNKTIHSKNLNESSETNSTDENIPHVKAIVQSFENQKVNIMWDKEKILKRPINIVKTIIVSGGKFEESQNIPVINQDESNSSNSVGSIDKNSSSSPMDKIDSDVLSLPNKRHRKRFRKRKKTISPTFDTPEEITQNGTFSSPILEKSNGVHIRFEDDEIVEKNISEHKDEASEVNSINMKEAVVSINCVNGSNAENIVTEPTKAEENKGFDQISEEFLFRQPALKDVTPKIGDVIAFKILRITENYSPEISMFVVGKVLEFDPESKTVSFCITQGLDQCLPPQGKFSVCEEDEAVSDSTTHQFILDALIEPRLLSC